MSPVVLESDNGNSPRSTVITRSVEVMDVTDPGKTNGSPAKDVPGSLPEDSPPDEKKNEGKKGTEGRDTPQSTEAPAAVAPQTYYHLGYEPPSPATGIAIGAYDAASFFQPGAFMPHSGSFGGPNTPLSPARPSIAMGGIPPASPLFPRMTSGGAHGNLPLEPRHAGGEPPSPVPYVAPHLGAGMYATYAAATNRTSSGEEQTTPNPQHSWIDTHGMPQGSPQGIPMSYSMPTRSAAGGRAYSFEEMLPPSAISEHDQSNPTYSPYNNGSQVNSAAGGTMFSQQWAQYGGPPDMYSPTPGSPLQPRPTAGMQMPYGGMQGNRHMAAYGQYYPASSPGPPIQTTASNKGPDGANLFIFHIPNHFTNLDMYQLFCPYGNLLSVRIMVEKESGRSRGFGFVSYDSPSAAAVAIKELNGFAIGNKRLKVQHKQIRQNDRESSHTPGAPPGTYAGAVADSSLHRPQFPAALPPSGAEAAQSLWYQQGTEAGAAAVEAGKLDDSAADTTATSTEPASMGLPVDAGSPLNALGTLQAALPEVAGKAGAE